MECPKCSFQNQEGIKFCGKCGERLGITCPKCNFTNSSQFKFCGKCGYKINENYELEKKYKNTKSERKYVTVFFTDLSGYTAMTERLDPENVRSILNRVFKKISDIIEKFDGFRASCRNYDYFSKIVLCSSVFYSFNLFFGFLPGKGL